MSPVLVAIWIWVSWLVTWGLAAFWTDRTVARPGAAAETPYRLVTILGTALLFIPPGAKWLRPSHGNAGLLPALFHPLWPISPTAGWLLCTSMLAGFVFCWWARLHLGSLWSGSVTRKTGHRIVDTGPYRLVRHPIYTGLVTAGLAMAMLRGSLAAMTGVVLLFLGCWMKARLEERFLREDLGPDYDAYSRRTPMILPFWPV